MVLRAVGLLPGRSAECRAGPRSQAVAESLNCSMRLSQHVLRSTFPNSAGNHRRSRKTSQRRHIISVRLSSNTSRNQRRTRRRITVKIPHHTSQHQRFQKRKPPRLEMIQHRPERLRAKSYPRMQSPRRVNIEHLRRHFHPPVNGVAEGPLRKHPPHHKPPPPTNPSPNGRHQTKTPLPTPATPQQLSKPHTSHR